MYLVSNILTTDAKCSLSLALASALFILVLAIGQASAQFSSGSTGADGPLNVGTLCPNAVCNLVIRDEPNSVFNFTTIDVPAGKTLHLVKNAQNSPAILLASGAVNIAGIIEVNGGIGNSASINGSRVGGVGGPGGYDGGGGGFSVAPFFNGNSGGGPGGGFGGGSPSSNSAISGGGAGYLLTNGGAVYGTKTLVPLIGGSGGGGGAGNATSGRGCGGGGGGGAILIASSTSITFSGSASIQAMGGSGTTTATTPTCAFNNGGSGSGGSIRVIANSMTGSVLFNVIGGPSQIGSPGRVRLESPSFSGLAPSTSPSNPEILSLANPNPVFPTSIPRLTITSVGGATVNNPSNSPHGNPDIIVPQTTPNPIVINAAAQNIPVGTFVQFYVIPQYGTSGSTIITKGSQLVGTTANSTTTDTINLPDGLSLITAVAVFDVSTPLAGYSPIYVNGEKVEKMRISASIDGTSEVTYILASGKEVKASR